NTSAPPVDDASRRSCSPRIRPHVRGVGAWSSNGWCPCSPSARSRCGSRISNPSASEPQASEGKSRTRRRNTRRRYARSWANRSVSLRDRVRRRARYMTALWNAWIGRRRPYGDRRREFAPLLLVLLAATSVFLFVNLAGEVVEGDTAAIDRAVLLWMRNPADLSDPIGPEWLERAAVDVTSLGGVTTLVLVS